jgi:hypothetical protein
MKFQNEWGTFSMGSLTEAKDHRKQCRLFRRLPANLPVLTSHLDAETYKSLSSQPDAPVSLGFGLISPPEGPVMTILLQKGTVQVYWLVDMSDPQLWATIDAWKREGEVPFILMAPEGSEPERFAGTCELYVPKQLNEWRKVASHDTHHVIWIDVCALASCGVLQRQATTDIRGVNVVHVHVNALKTRRSAKFDARMPNLNKPVS